MKKEPDTLVRCIYGSYTVYENCIGFCNSAYHKGYITQNIERQHSCFKKRCKNFQQISKNPYWRKKDKNAELKEALKKVKKVHKDMEQSIIDNAPENSEPLYCTYLYDNTYFLLLKEYVEIPCKYYKELLGVDVYIQYVPEGKQNNIDVLFSRFLPDEMRQKYLNKKNGRYKRHM